MSEGYLTHRAGLVAGQTQMINGKLYRLTDVRPQGGGASPVVYAVTIVPVGKRTTPAEGTDDAALNRQTRTTNRADPPI